MTSRRLNNWLTAITCVALFTFAADAQTTRPAQSISYRDGRLRYTADALGNRIPDFSHAGFGGGGVAIPNAPVRVVVSPVEGDQTARIQAAIDHVASLPVGADGLRGAVLLAPGHFEVRGELRIAASGVVLRGSGMGEGGTVLTAAGQDRRTVVTIAGLDDKTVAEETAIADDYVPVNATRLRLAAGGTYRPGDSVAIRRRATPEWIAALGMDNMGGERHGFRWRPGSREITWHRTIQAVQGDEIEFDAPITTAIESRFGGGSVAKVAWPGRIQRAGVENLRIESAYDATRPLDEDHAWHGVTLECVRDAWVRRVQFSHFSGGAVACFEGAQRVTVEDCRSIRPVGEIAGARRVTFFTSGQQTLFLRCWSEDGRHDFAAGFLAAGPSAFVQCEAVRAHDFSGAIDSWASGVLWDNIRIDGNALLLGNRMSDGQGAGWTAANCLIWQSTAAVIDCYAPPGATNWAVGCWGQFAGDGQWISCNESVDPHSLYFAQLAERVGRDVLKTADLLQVQSDASSSPTPQQAAELTAAARQPAPSLAAWIDDSSRRRPIPIDPAGGTSIDELWQPAADIVLAPPPLEVRNGWLVADGKVLVGSRIATPWWRGGARPSDLAAQAGSPALTRFVPGRSGPGATDRLEDVAAHMRNRGIIAFEQHYGLWYDRRRDDHQRVRRMTGDVWPPFYDQPFSRSGRGSGYDGLSLYDLSTYNPWYFARVARFAHLCAAGGRVLINHHYFQHNILEAGAHYADFPWRTANNINNTGFPEPPNYAGDKRIFMAEQFYDLSDSTRRALHRAYIRHTLDQLAGGSVIHLLSEEYTGPLHFMQFWIDTIDEWQKETGRDVLVGLSATKDVQDAILSDGARARVVDIIDIRYWWYQEDGDVYAPPGGQNLAPRQWARVLKPKPTSADQVYRAVREYRSKYPDKAVMYSADASDKHGWAVLMAGGSLATVKLDDEAARATAAMQPVKPGQYAPDWALADDSGAMLRYRRGQGSIDVAGMIARRIDPRTGVVHDGADNGEILWIVPDRSRR